MVEDGRDITTLLNAIRSGDEQARHALFNHVYDDLVDIARRQMRAERGGHTLQTTALVHEAYLKLNKGNVLESIENRRHFYASVMCVMRQLLIEHARARQAKKRSGDGSRVLLDAVLDELEYVHQVDYLDLDDALVELSRLDERQCRIVELRFLGGLEVAEVALQLGVSKSTVEKDFRSARAWLNARLG